MSDLPTDRRRVGSGVEWEERYGYSRAVRVGRRILVAGTTATGPDGVVALGDPGGQARYALDKIERAIGELGGRLADVVRTRIYVSDVGHWQEVAEAHGERFAEIRPANTLIVAPLIGEEYLVEIEAEAVVSEAPGSGISAEGDDG